MRYNYNNIVRIVSINLGNKAPNSVDVSIIKNDIYSSLTKVYRKTKPAKETKIYNIKETKGEILLPENFFVADEIVFKDLDGNIYLSKEITEEQFLRWSPNVFQTDSNFENEVLGESVGKIIYTNDNSELDGYIGYCISDKENSMLLKYKPTINGTLDVFFSVFPEDSIPDINDYPHVHKAFIDVLILGATISGLIRQKPTNEIDLGDKTLKLRLYKDEYAQALSDYAGYVNRSVETPIVQPFDFLNFYDDIIYG